MKARFLLLAVALVPLAAAPARATVTEYHTFAQSYTDTLVQYDFDGDDANEQREDKTSGTNYLVEKLGGPGDPGYALLGFDATSQAVRTNAGGFFTGSAIGLPSTVSFEAIVCPDKYTASYSSGMVAGAFTTVSGTTERSYFGVQQPYTSSDGRLFAVVGSFSNQVSIVTPYTKDE